MKCSFHFHFHFQFQIWFSIYFLLKLRVFFYIYSFIYLLRPIKNYLDIFKKIINTMNILKPSVPVNKIKDPLNRYK